MATLDIAQPLIDFDGNIAYLTPDKLYVYNVNTDDQGIEGILFSGASDLGEPSIDKLLNFIDVDYIGQFMIYFTYDDPAGTTSSYLLPAKSTRGTHWLYIPLTERRPFKKVKYAIIGPTHGTIIYGLEIDFSVLRRRRVS